MKGKYAGDVWFTDEADNAICGFSDSSHAFEIYNVRGKSSYFDTTYPISIEFDANDDRCIFFVGTFSSSLWIGDITKMNNGTSDGIKQVPIAIVDKFKGIESYPYYYWLYRLWGYLLLRKERICNILLVSTVDKAKY